MSFLLFALLSPSAVLAEAEVDPAPPAVVSTSNEIAPTAPPEIVPEVLVVDTAAAPLVERWESDDSSSGFERMRPGFSFNFILGRKQFAAGQDWSDSSWWPAEKASIGRNLGRSSEFQQQVSLGFESTIGVRPEPWWMVGVAVDLIRTAGEDDTVVYFPWPYVQRRIEVAVRTSELDLGARVVWRREPLQAHAGGGVARISAESTHTWSGSDWSGTTPDFGSESTSAQGTGIWLGVGCNVQVRKPWTVGVSLRYSTARLRSGGFDVDGGGLNTALALGLSL